MLFRGWFLFLSVFELLPLYRLLFTNYKVSRNPWLREWPKEVDTPTFRLLYETFLGMLVASRLGVVWAPSSPPVLAVATAVHWLEFMFFGIALNRCKLKREVHIFLIIAFNAVLLSSALYTSEFYLTPWE